MTVVEFMPSLLPGADEDLVRPLARKLKKAFENIYLSTKVSKVEPMLKGVDIYLVNQRLAKQAARRIKKHMEVVAKESFRNYSWDHEKDRPKRRITILLKQKVRK